MTKTVLCLAAMAAFSTQLASADTLVASADSATVTVVTSPGRSEITVSGTDGSQSYIYRFDNSTDSSVAPKQSEWDLNLPFLRQQPRTGWHTRCMEGVYAGYAAVHGAPDGLKSGFEIGISEVVGVQWNPISPRGYFHTGIGFGVSTFATEKGYRFTRTADGVLGIEPCSYDRSSGSLSICRFTIPLMYTQRVNRWLGFTIGGNLNLNTYASASTSWRNGDIKHDERYTGLHQRILTADITLGVCLFDDMGIYVRFSPIKAFQHGWGPDMTTFSVGVKIGF